jgi:hypothetical protein
MPNPVEYTTWHTSRIPPLGDKETSPSHHPCSHFFQLCLGIKGHSDGFAILDAKVFENLLEIPNLADVMKTLCTILFNFHAKEEIQIPKIFHFKLLRKFFLHLQKLVLIIAHQDEIIHIDDNEKFDISDLRNVHAKVRITPPKLNVFQNNI